MDMYASFGRGLKLRRRALDLTQDDLARQVGCSVVTIRKLEADERRPSRQIAERLAECLVIQPDDRPAFLTLARGETYAGRPAASDPLGTPTVVRPRSRSNLPTPLTRLIGRKQEVAALRTTLLRGDTRLLTLVGPPGIGKTRLSVEVGGELRDAFADGVYFVSLAAIGDPELVIGAIGHVLGLRESGGRPIATIVRDFLQDRRTLLLLDNFEQVVDGAPLVVALLEDCPGVKALVTSRATLHVRGEQVLQLEPLALPPLGSRAATRAIVQSPAVALFVERAQAAAPGFSLNEANAAVVAEICTRLDGLPLAIELVAARVKLLPPAALLAGIEGAPAGQAGRALGLLTDGPRDLPPRHQTLRAAIAGSYDLLGSREQVVFRRLGVLVGAWTAEAAEAIYVAGEEPGHASQMALLHDLSALLDQSLLRRPAASSPAADVTPRFTMLQTIREYARELLGGHGEASAIRHAHAAYFLRLAEQAEREMHGPHQVEWLDRLEDEHPNLRTALQWSLQAAEVETALRLGGALWWFWSVRGYGGEGRRWLERALDLEARWPAPDTADDTPGQERQAHRATALYGAGHMALFQGDFARARSLLARSAAFWLPRADQPASRRALIFAVAFLILAAQFQGDDAAMQELVPEFGRLTGELDDPYARAFVLFSRGRGALLQHGNYQEARTLLEQSLAIWRTLGNTWYIAQAVIDLGLVALYLDDAETARGRYEEGLLLARALKDPALVAFALNNLGEVARFQEDDRAAPLYAESLQLYRDIGNKPEVPRLLHNQGYVALKRGELQAATTHFRESMALFRELNMDRGVAETLAGLAAVAAVQRRPEQAARLWGAAEALHEAVGTPVWPADRREHTRYQAIARAQMDQPAWEAAWQEGRSMPAELALEGA